MTISEHRDLIVHLQDLQEKSQLWQRHAESDFLNEEEQACARRILPESKLVRYDGGYPGARKCKVIFLKDEEDDFSDIVCLMAKVDQRFKSIGHRDVLGALMHLQIERDSFGDFWIEEDRIYLYTSGQMGRFLCDQLTRIGRFNVSFELLEEHPVQKFCTKSFSLPIASLRVDAMVAGLAHCSRGQSVEKIRAGHVQVDHVPVSKADQQVHEGAVLSIRGSGRFTFTHTTGKTRKDRVVAEFEQDVQINEAEGRK